MILTLAEVIVNHTVGADKTFGIESSEQCAVTYLTVTDHDTCGNDIALLDLCLTFVGHSLDIHTRLCDLARLDLAPCLYHGRQYSLCQIIVVEGSIPIRQEGTCCAIHRPHHAVCILCLHPVIDVVAQQVR